MKRDCSGNDMTSRAVLRVLGRGQEGFQLARRAGVLAGRGKSAVDQMQIAKAAGSARFT